MNLAGTRAAIAAQLSTIVGVTGYEKRPGTIKAGAAWPLLESIERGPGLAFLINWRIILAVGGTELDAQDKLDLLVPTIAISLEPVVYVGELITPITISTNLGDLFAVEIQARSE